MRHESESFPASAVVAIGGAKTSTPALDSMPAALVEVALIDAKTSAATGSMGVSWWLAEVAAGRAPAPVIRAPRCTRWTLSSVRDFWIARATQGAANASAAEALKVAAKKASHAAQVKRRSKVASAKQ